MSMMTYKGYGASIDYSQEDEAFIGRVLGIVDIVTFHGESVEELKLAFQEAVDFYLDSCKAKGIEPNKPFSGNLMLRIPKEVHAKIAMIANANHKSINQWASETLTKAID